MPEESAEIPKGVKLKEKRVSSLEFIPRPEPSKLHREEIQAFPQKTELRTKITGRFVEVLNEACQAAGEKTSWFRKLLSLAERSFGERTAQLYQDLSEAAYTYSGPTRLEEGREINRQVLLKELGFSLLKTGYVKEAKEPLRHYWNNHLKSFDLEQGLWEFFDKDGEFAKELAEAGEKEVIQQIPSDIERKADFLHDSLPGRLERFYAREGYDGQFSEQGQRAVADLVKTKKEKGELLTAKDFHQLVLDLCQSGDYQCDWFDPEDSDDRDFPPTPWEEQYYEDLTYLCNLARKLSETSSLLEADNPDLSQQYLKLAGKLYDLDLFGIRHYRRISERLKERPFEDAAGGLIKRLLGDRNFFDKGAELVSSSVESSYEKIEFFNYDDAKQVLAELPQTSFEEYMKKWQETLERISIPEHRDYFFCNQRWQIAKAFLQRKEEKYKQKGLEIVEALPQRKTSYPNSHRYVSHKDFLFGKPPAYSIYTLPYFNEAAFKARALLKTGEFSPSDKKRLVEKAFELAHDLTIDTIDIKRETFYQSEDKTYLLMELMEGLLETDEVAKAEKIYQKIDGWLDKTRKFWQKKLEDFRLLSKREQEEQWQERSELEGNIEDSLFWSQHLQSSLKAKLAVGLTGDGQKEKARLLAGELLEGFSRDIHARRERFEPRSMTTTASALAEAEVFKGHSQKLFESCIEKIALLRGERSLFDNAVSFFSEKVREANLPDEAKDGLLSQFILALVPPEKRNWREMVETIPALAKLAKDITKENKYPQAELETLKFFADLASEVRFERDNRFAMEAEMGALKEVFLNITEVHPELLIGSNFNLLVDVSSDPEYLTALAALLPEQAERFFAGGVVEDGVFNLVMLRSGLYEKESVYKTAKVELKRVLISPELTAERLEHLMGVYSELISQELADFRNEQDSPYYKVTLKDLFQLQGIQDLHTLIKGKLKTKEAEFTLSETRILQTLLRADSQEEANGKYALYKELLGNFEVPLEAQRLAFENLVKTNRISRYISCYFEQEIIGADDRTQREFYRWMKEFLVAEKGKLPSDRMVSFLLENSEEAEEFFTSYHRSCGKQTVPREVEGYFDKDDFESRFHKRLDEYFKGIEEEFFQIWADFVKQGDFWVPDLVSEADLILAYERTSFLTFDEFIETIRHIYIDNSFNLLNPENYRHLYTTEQLEKALGKVMPGFKFSSRQKERILELFAENKVNPEWSEGYQRKVQEIPTDRGKISCRQLQDQVLERDLDLKERHQRQLKIFLRGLRDESWSYFQVLRLFGPRNFSYQKRQELDLFLDRVKREFSQREEKVKMVQFEIPSVFAETPEVVRFLMAQYFIKLPFGEREAILNEFEAEKPLPAPKAIKRFFELTGTEKVGQFLSTRRDFIPEDYRRELEQFQEEVEPSAFDEARETVEEEFGKEVGEIFESLEPEAFRIGTIGEVFKGVLKNGQKIVVKVITPSKHRSIEKMLERLEEVCRALERNQERFPGAYNPMALFKEFEASIREELDFRNEYQHAQRIKKELKGGISVPGYVDQLCTESVLTQTFARGRHIDQVENQAIRHSVANKLGEMLISQFLKADVFHEDLHPGNVRVIPETGEIELLDFGRIGETNKKEREALVPFLMAIRNNRVKEIVNLLQSVSPKGDNFDRIGLEKALETRLQGENRPPTSVLISEIFFECGNHGLAVTPAYLRMLKGVMTFEGTALQLNSNFNLETFIREAVLRKK